MICWLVYGYVSCFETSDVFMYGQVYYVPLIVCFQHVHVCFIKQEAAINSLNGAKQENKTQYTTNGTKIQTHQSPSKSGALIRQGYLFYGHSNFQNLRLSSRPLSSSSFCSASLDYFQMCFCYTY